MAAFMTVPVRLFGPLAEQAGTDRVEVLTPGGTVDDVVAALKGVLPGLRLDGRVRVAVNLDYATPATAVNPGDVVSLIPPVGGG
jgi:molybdopterin converting factor small subunit